MRSKTSLFPDPECLLGAALLIALEYERSESMARLFRECD